MSPDLILNLQLYESFSHCAHSIAASLLTLSINIALISKPNWHYYLYCTDNKKWNQVSKRVSYEAVLNIYLKYQNIINCLISTGLMLEVHITLNMV